MKINSSSAKLFSWIPKDFDVVPWIERIDALPTADDAGSEGAGEWLSW